MSTAQESASTSVSGIPFSRFVVSSFISFTLLSYVSNKSFDTPTTKIIHDKDKCIVIRGKSDESSLYILDKGRVQPIPSWRSAFNPKIVFPNGYKLKRMLLDVYTLEAVWFLLEIREKEGAPLFIIKNCNITESDIANEIQSTKRLQM